MSPKVIILSGGPNSVHVEGSPRVPEDFFEYCRQEDIPVLGICYGMQLIVQVRQAGCTLAAGGGAAGHEEPSARSDACGSPTCSRSTIQSAQLSCWPLCKPSNPDKPPARDTLDPLLSLLSRTPPPRLVSQHRCWVAL